VCQGSGVVREADPQRDGAPCAAIYAPYVSDGVASFEADPPGPEEMAERIARTWETHPWLVAERDGEVAGFAYGCPHRPRAAYRWAADASVYVAAAHQRAGVGRELYLDLFSRLRHQGIRTVCAGITLPNPASVGLHEAMGFRLVGVYRAIGFKFGAWHDVGWWQLELHPPGGEPPAEPGPPPGRPR
jgi:phosphinothricin acetyltransferase